MEKVTCLYIFFLLYSFSFSETNELDYYNLEIKNKISNDYSGSFDNINNSESHEIGEHHQKWFAEDFFKSTEKYFKRKEKEYKEYKKNLELRISKNLNETIVPSYMDDRLEVIVKLEENAEDFKLKYRYTPNLIKESHIDLGIEEEEFKLSYVYERPVTGFEGLGGYFFNSVAYIFDNSVKNILEISKMKVK